MSNLIFSQANEGLELPNGFQAVKFADSVGRARHIAVSNDGKVFVKLNKTINNAGIICLEDSDKDGLADKQKSFGNYIGTGIFIKNNYLYASSNSAIFRYKLDVNNNVLDTVPEVIVKGLIARKKHESKAFTLDNAGNIFVDIGA
ncbi:MAG: sorbosone dehydrogenase, partial [Pseudarcicella sp.]|nr:sorbosone dehydrogenase [Pseudarcicella sp.]